MSEEYPPVRLLQASRRYEFLNMFGKAEVEAASAIIAAKVRAEGRWEVQVTIDDFGTRGVRAGFLLLLSRGWMREGGCTGSFEPTPEWAERIVRLQGIDPQRRHFER